MHPNSLKTYHEEVHNLRGRSREVFQYLIENGEATDREVMKGLGYLEPNHVRPRITELVGLNLVVETGSTKDRWTGKTVRTVNAVRVDANAQMEMF